MLVNTVLTTDKVVIHIPKSDANYAKFFIMLLIVQHFLIFTSSVQNFTHSRKLWALITIMHNWSSLHCSFYFSVLNVVAGNFLLVILNAVISIMSVL